MNDTDRLVQRFVDQDLSAEERVRFLARLGQDDALRRRALALEHIALAARGLPRPAVPAGFVEGVLARTTPRRPWQRVLDLLVAPRTLRWNLATAGAGAVLVAIVVGGLVGRMGSMSSPQAGAGTGAGASPVLVRLVVVQPGARTVEAAGDFNGWDPARTPLEHVANGAWAVTIPLEPGRYEYMFVIDGEDWIADPLAIEQSDDGFGSRNAVIDVRPPEVSL